MGRPGGGRLRTRRLGAADGDAGAHQSGHLHAAETDGGLVALTHLWWHAEGPETDPLAEDMDLPRANRAKVLAQRPALIIPGHGTPFAPK